MKKRLDVISTIILNEKIYAEECLRKKTLGLEPSYTLSVLAKYFHSKKYSKKQIVELLIDFMSQYYPRYDCNKSAWDEFIDKIVKNVDKYGLIEVDGVCVTAAELETIDKIHDKVLERLAFTLLCIAKFNNKVNSNNNSWVNNEAKEIFSLARISCRASERYEKLGKLHELALLEFPKRIDNLSCRVTYVNDNSDNVLFVSDFRALGYEYLKYKGGNFIRCKDCGLLTRNNKRGTKKYCKDCAGYVPQEYKTVTCEDCGRQFEIDSKNNQTSRCPDCYTKYRQEQIRVNVKKYRDKISCNQHN